MLAVNDTEADFMGDLKHVDSCRRFPSVELSFLPSTLSSLPSIFHPPFSARAMCAAPETNLELAEYTNKNLGDKYIHM